MYSHNNDTLNREHLALLHKETLLVWLKQGNEKQTTTGQYNGVGGDQSKTKTK
jgi:hypothetical protein